MCRRYGNFVDPKLRQLVWMHVMDGGRKTQHQIIFNCDREMMTRIAEKFAGQLHVDGAVKHGWCDACKNVIVAVTQKLNLDRHSALCSLTRLLQRSRL